MLSVGRSPKASRFTCFHSVSIAFNSGVARGSKRISIPKHSAHHKLSGAVCCPARSSKSTMSQPHQWDRTWDRNLRDVTWFHSFVTSNTTSPVPTLIAPCRMRRLWLPVIGTDTC